jgi:hypothetical protein
VGEHEGPLPHPAQDSASMTGARLRDGPEADICIYDRKTTTRANRFVVE